jgi:glycosyltransferase involved in cell wall biosynthesis
MSKLITPPPASPWPDRPRQAARLDHLERMALVTGNYINVVDGAVLTLHRIVETLSERGVEVAVVAPTANSTTTSDDLRLAAPELMFEVPSLPMPVQDYRVPVGLGRQARSQLERFDPQLIHVTSPEPASVMAIHFAKQHGVPVTSSFHTNFPAYLNYWQWPLGKLSPVAWKLLQWFYAPCDQVFVPTESMGEELVARGVLDGWAMLARGVDPSSFGRQFRSMRWRQRLGIGAKERVVLFCARIVWEKGLRTLVAALENLGTQGPTHQVVVVGDGVQRGWLESQLPDAIFTGFMTDDELAQAYASADVFIYPSTTETFGNVTLEAMASGLPVIGARAPGTRSIVIDGQSGLLVPPDDADALSEACAKVLADDTLRWRLGRGAIARAEDFRWPNILDAFAAELDAIVGEFHAAEHRSRSAKKSG